MAIGDPFERQGNSPVAPPTRASPISIGRTQGKWPTVLGIIAIVLALLALLSFAGQLLTRFVPRPAGASQPAAIAPPQAWTAIASALGVILALLLLIGGIGLVRRSRWSARVLTVWALGALVLAVVGLTVTGLNLSAIEDEMRRQNPSMPPVASGVMHAVLLGSLCFGTLLSLVPPVFTLIWFGRGSVKAEVAAWA
jgi:hypothetical protein